MPRKTQRSLLIFKIYFIKLAQKTEVQGSWLLPGKELQILTPWVQLMSSACQHGGRGAERGLLQIGRLAAF
jgi:hypothetical protein